MRMTAGQQHRANIASRNFAINHNDCWGNPISRADKTLMLSYEFMSAAGTRVCKQTEISYPANSNKAAAVEQFKKDHPYAENVKEFSAP